MTRPSVASDGVRDAGRVDLLRGYEVVSEDVEWPIKIALHLLIWAVPVLGWLVVTGWLSYGARRAVAGVRPVLLPPTFDPTTLVDYALQGLKAMVVGVVWSLPAIAFTIATVGCVYFGVVASLLSAATGAESTHGLSLAMIPLVVCGALVLFVAVGIVNALLSLPATAAALRVELSGSLAQGFEVSGVSAMVRTVLRAWVLNLVLLVMLAWTGVFIGNVVPVIGVLAVTFLLAIARVFAAVSLYEKYLAAGGTPVPLGPVEPPVAPR
ncbi:MAG: hypothetical protein OHK0013_39460 [Sandaracinaceae bacterium]